MEILGIGPSELIFVIIIALIVLGPKDMQKAGKTIGQWLNNFVKSDGWKAFQQTSRELRNLPTNLMREANADLRETEKDIRQSIGPSPFAYPSKPTPVSSPTPGLTQSHEAENTIQPPSANPIAQVATATAQAAVLGSEDGVGSISKEDGVESTSNVSAPNQNA